MCGKGKSELWYGPRHRDHASSFQCPSHTSNVENAELYSVHPYRLFGVGKDNLSVRLPMDDICCILAYARADK